MKLGEILKEDRKKYDSTLEQKVDKEFCRLKLEPEVHYKIGVYTVDFAFPEYKYAIEIDGKDFHSSAKDVDRDKRKEVFLKKRKWIVKRYQGWLAHRHPDLPACEYVLRTLKNPTQEQIDLATGILIKVHLRTLDRDIGKKVAESYLKTRFENI